MAQTTETECFKMVENRGGQCGNATRRCASPVVYVDPQGRGWCKRHEPDPDRKATWERTRKEVR